jgi:quinolinate synthase
MADMAAIDQLEIAWEEMRRMGATSVVPVTYVNSSADIKGFCGEHGGIVCTSSNAAKVMAWAWDRAEKLIMLPDQHLGRNTAFKMGVPLDDMVLWDRTCRTAASPSMSFAANSYCGRTTAAYTRFPSNRWSLH